MDGTQIDNVISRQESMIKINIRVSVLLVTSVQLKFNAQ